ncbi:MAG: threonine--tRNA ligase [Oscillospiraceae bacterium]|nr:threonine--tRNA ligase [Oscillospiraceae bacterium]
MLKLTLKDGSVREAAAGTPAYEVIKEIGMGLYKAACVVKLNDVVCDLRTPITEDCTFEVLTFDSKHGKAAFWHTASHLLAQAVKNLYPEAKLARGPATENGFYYDFQVEKPFTPADLTKIEAEMKRLAKEGYELERFELSHDEAVKLMQEKNETFKLELIEKHDSKGEKLSFYKQGDFVDLCAGPHIMNVAPIKAVKLTQCTGAYWGKAEDGIMLSRVYGTAYPKASMLDEHLKAMEEAKLRDHNKLGRELEYFTTVDYIGQGLPILLPKGAKVIQTLQRWIEDEEYKRGYLLTKTPYMAKRDLYKISGHWDHYRDGMFILGDPDDEEKECLALRPMTCPFQYQVFLNRKRSYRDLPMRLNETSILFRNEDSGEMHGLIRVRQFTLSEGHLIIRPEQLEEEFRGCLDLAKYCLETLGLAEDVSYRFSQWDPANPNNKYEGTAEQWDESQGVMKKILDHIGIDYEVGIDEAAFYGPKLDIQIKNVFGKEDTLITIQIDMLLAKKFGMEYVDKDGKMKTPYIIHRSSLGCYERTLALLIEKYSGALPMWIAPEQVRILPIKPEHNDYAYDIKDKLDAQGIRVEVDFEDDNIGTKIKRGRYDRIPYLFIIGDNEVNDGTVTIRSRKNGDLGAFPAADAIARIVSEDRSRSRDN